MKSWKIVVPVLLVMCLASMASAAEMSTGSGMKGHLTLGANGGLAVPSGKLSANFTDNGADMGLGWDAGGSLDWFATDQLAIGADVSFGSMKSKDDPNPGEELKAKTLSYGVHGRWYIPTGGGKMLPWLGAGVAMYNRKISDEVPGASIELSDTKPGANFGVGIEYLASEMVGLGINGTYDLTFGKWEQDINGDGVNDAVLDNWNLMRFNAAVTFHFPHAAAK